MAGAGIGGLAAAAAVSPFFRQVTVFEKDRLPSRPVPRKGVAQGGHAHVFLVGGLASLDGLLPGVRRDFMRAGAVAIDIGSDFVKFDLGSRRPPRALGMEFACLSRPAYEQVVRNRTRRLANVRIADGARVDAVAFEAGNAAGLIVDGRIVRAELTVDATGRGGSLAEQLEREGFGPTPRERIGIDMCYSSGRFRVPERWRHDSAAICVPTPPDKRFGIILPVEDGQCIASLGGRCGVEAPTDRDGFLAFARQLACPALFERIAGAELLAPIRRYRIPTANWHRYDRLGRFPGVLAPVGDTIASFNPTFGQGMTVAVRHALALREVLVEAGLDSPDFANRYLAAAAAASEVAWNSAALVDLAYPEVAGIRRAGFEEALAFRRGLRLLSDTDPDVNRLEAEVTHMVKPPSALRDPDLGARIAAALALSGRTAHREAPHGASAAA